MWASLGFLPVDVRGKAPGKMSALTAACAAGDERSVLHLLHGAAGGGGGGAGGGGGGVGRRSPNRVSRSLSIGRGSGGSSSGSSGGGGGGGAAPLPSATAPFLDEVDEDGMSGMMRAAVCGQHKIVKLLHEHGASVSAARKDGMTPLMLATRPGHENQ